MPVPLAPEGSPNASGRYFQGIEVLSKGRVPAGVGSQAGSGGYLNVPVLTVLISTA